MNADGSGQPVNISKISGVDHYQVWSPDGKQIAYMSHGSDRTLIYVVDPNVENPEPKPVKDEPNINQYYPAWSPDGTRIAFQKITENGVTLGIYVMDADGTNEEFLVNDPDLLVRYPLVAWSPDSKKIAFTSERTGNFEIYVMDASEGSDQINITQNTASDYAPAWRPSAPITIATGVAAYFLTVDQDNVYWTTEEDRFGGPGILVKKVSTVGGEVSTLADVKIPVSVRNIAKGIVVDDTYVYWATRLGGDNGNGAIFRVDKNVTETVINPPPLAEADRPETMAVDNQNIYWGERGGGVKKLPRAGGNPVELTAIDNVFAVDPIAIDNTYAYFAYFLRGSLGKPGRIGKVRKDLTAPGVPDDLVTSGLFIPLNWPGFTINGIVVGGGYVYWVNNIDGTVDKASVNGGPVETVAEGLIKPERIVADNMHVYWIDWGDSSNPGALMRAPLSSGEVCTLESCTIVPNIGIIHSDIAIDDTFVYFSDGNGIKKIRKH